MIKVVIRIDRLCLTYEGTNEVKETQINTLLSEYELFRMLPNETISDMFTRFTKVTTSLFSLGKFFTGTEKVRKILRSLPKSWIDPNPSVLPLRVIYNYKCSWGNSFHYIISQLKNSSSFKPPWHQFRGSYLKPKQNL